MKTIKNSKQYKINKIKTIIKYTDEEKNEFSYELALQYDKRNYCDYYISLLKTKHDFIFSFINSDDYNSRIIKIVLFFLFLQ